MDRRPAADEQSARCWLPAQVRAHIECLVGADMAQAVFVAHVCSWVECVPAPASPGLHSRAASVQIHPSHEPPQASLSSPAPTARPLPCRAAFPCPLDLILISCFLFGRAAAAGAGPCSHASSARRGLQSCGGSCSVRRLALLRTLLPPPSPVAARKYGAQCWPVLATKTKTRTGGSPRLRTHAHATRACA